MYFIWQDSKTETEERNCECYREGQSPAIGQGWQTYLEDLIVSDFHKVVALESGVGTAMA